MKKKQLFTWDMQRFATDLRGLKQKHASLCDDQQKVLDKAAAETRGMTEEEKTQFNELQKQIDGLTETIKAAETVDKRNKDLDEPDGKKFRTPADMSTQEEKKDDGGFKSLGEFMACVKFGDTKGRLKDLSTGDVGILIPPQFSQTIMRLSPEAEIVMPRATVIPAGDPPDSPLTIPYMQQGDLGANGGVALVWTNEGKEVAAAGQAVIKDMTLKPNEVSGLATINNQTLANWKASGAFVEMTMRQAFVSGRDMKFLQGSGVGCPVGVLKATGAMKVARKTATLITYEDIVNMLAKLLPEAVSGAVFVASITDIPQLMTLQDAAGNYIFSRGDATRGIPANLLGFPIIWNGKVSTLGNEGDISLINFSYYLIKEGSGPYIAISEHVKFTTNKTVFKIVANIDGQPWVKDPLLLEDGKTKVSPYVILK